MYQKYSIDLLAESAYNVAIYCAGLHGVEFKRILETCGINVNLFIDNDVEKNGKIIDNVPCLLPNNIGNKSIYKVIICVAIENYNSVFETALKQGFKNIIDFREILDDLIVNKERLFLELMRLRYKSKQADLFYTNDGRINNYNCGINITQNERIAVYTGLFGGYDNFYEPLMISPNVDYFYISDEQPKSLKIYSWIDAKTIIPSGISSPIKRNRYIKMHPHLIFHNYKFSLYLDSNIQIVGDVSKLFNESKCGISVFKHWKRDCLYYEAMTIVNNKRIVPEDAIRQIKRYMSEGFPIHYGLPELPVIARTHMNKMCIDIMNSWWHEFDNECQRDQVSFPYAMWINKVNMTDLGILGNDVRSCNLLKFHEHINDSKWIQNEKNLI